MKILVFNGSPKKEKSDTMHLTKAFIEGMNEVQDNEILTINSIEENVKPCTGCFTCKKNGGNCIYDDDMTNILEKILNTDIIIWSFPLYAYSMPSTLKAIIDRTMPLSTMAMRKVNGRYEHNSKHNLSKLKYVMISGCGFPNFKNNFENMIGQFINMFGEENSTIIAVPESPMFNVKEAEIVTMPFLKNVKTAGREYAQTGKISNETMKLLNTPMIPEEQYVKICNG